jgi:hypothetical protein
MKSILNTYSGILQLRTDTFVAIKQSRDGFGVALRIFAVVSLIAALGQWLELGAVLRQPTLPEQVHQIAQVIEGIEQNLPDWLPQTMSEGLSTFARESVGFVTGVEERTANLMPPLGARPSRVVNLLGQWLGTPFRLMANFLGCALVVLVVVKVMGGKGTLQQHLSLTMLAGAPYVLAFVGYIPAGSVIVGFALGIFGRTLTLLAGMWAAAILIKALTIAHEIELKRAALALVSAFVVVYLLIPMAAVMAAGYVLFG